MKKFILIFFVSAGLCTMSCRVKYGCPSSGRNIGAEKLISGDKATMKAAKKAGKFRGGKY